MRPAELLVGADTTDDAAVWQLDDTRALVLTTDFITPLVDDAATWGRIAAANAASDVYAMGGRPFLALNLVGWNREALGLDLLADVLRGAAEAAVEGGWVTVGGHTVDDPEPKFGLVVIGDAAPDRLLTNAGLQPGQALVLTKPIGSGVIATAVKQDAASPQVLEAAIAEMTRLNAAALDAARTAGATGATDVTGFGLLGHLRELVEQSGVDAAVDADAVPLLPGARELVEQGYVPGGSRRNREWCAEVCDLGAVDETLAALLTDAQTSGGLLFGAPPEAAEQAASALRASGHHAAVVGEVLPGDGRLTLR